MDIFTVVTGAVGVIDGTVGLIQKATLLGQHIEQFRGNPEQKARLEKLIAKLLKILKSTQTVSCDAIELTQEELQSAENELKAILEGRQLCARCLMASYDHTKLQMVEERLRNLMTQIVVVGGMLQIGSTAPRICNDSVELPPCEVGLQRADPALNFLRTSESEPLRVIAIHGPPGVGKTTLLNYIWAKAALKAPFEERALVEITSICGPPNICSLQARIVQQLSGESKTFSSHDFGKGELRKCFQKLKAENRPVFVAIDHPDWEIDHLPNLLPSDDPASRDFPASSCIAVACTNLKVLEGLLSTCNIQRNNQAQVFCFQPPYLDEDKARQLLATCAGIQNSVTKEHQVLLTALAPLCGGLPSALTVLGKTLFDEEKQKKWKSLEEPWAELDADNADTSRVRKPLQQNYERLGSVSRQAAFLDIVTIFYGWPWEEVERILGESTMEDLLNSSLISKAEGIDKCSKRELEKRADTHRRCRHDIVDKQAGSVPANNKNQRQDQAHIVSMHDLILRFGEGIVKSHLQNIIGYRQRKFKCPTDQYFERHHFCEAENLRNLILSSSCFHDDKLAKLMPQILCVATNLRMLVLRVDSSMDDEEPFLQASYCQSISSSEQHLSYLMLVGWKSSKPIFETKVSSQIRDITLDNCDDLEESPSSTPFHKLERLRIRNCQKFKGFSETDVKEWQSLRELLLEGCHMVNTIPEKMGELSCLKHLCLKSCGNIEKVPDSIRAMTSLETLDVHCCASLSKEGMV